MKQLPAVVVQLSASTRAVITGREGVDLLRGRERWHLTAAEAAKLAAALTPSEGDPE